MAIDTSTPRSRRALLTGGLSGLVALGASALGRPAPVQAGVDGDVVLGASNATTDTTSLYNTTNSNTVLSLTANANGNGVLSGSTAGSGVWGYSTSGAGGYVTSESSTGVYARSTTGLALAVNGKASFSRSGRASVPAGKSYADITPVGGLGGVPKILATPQVKRAGVYVAAVRSNYPTAGKAGIYLNKVASTTKSTPVAWFVIG